jgi:phospholipid/cholesterol/gamma-HCH transport system substrate-binding protein
VNYAIVGAFVLVLGAVLITGVLWLASGGAFKKNYDLYLAIVDESVAGLNLNAPVKYSGVEVGKVKNIQLDPANSQRVRLIFAIERGTPITDDTVAMLKTQGLTGIASIELSGGARELPPLPASAPGQYPEIRTKPSLSARLENVLTNVLAKLDSTSSSINAILNEENQAAFKSALADIATVAHTIAERKDTLDTGIANAASTFEDIATVAHTFAERKDTLDAGIANAASTVENISRATVQLDQVIERIGRSADAVEKMGNEITQTTASAGNTANSIGADIKRFTAETLPELERLFGELSVLSASLRRLTEQTERDPAGLLFGRKPVAEGPGESSTGAQ